MELLYYKDNPEAFLLAIKKDAFPYLDAESFRLNSQYYKHYFGNNCIDFSFAIIDRERCLAIVPCQKIDLALVHNGGPISVHISTLIDSDRKITQFLCDTFKEIMCEQRIEKAVIRTSIKSGVISSLADRFLKITKSPEILFHSTVDLLEDEKNIHSGLRSSYSSLISWGKKNIDTTYMTSANADRKRFDEIRMFHAHVAGRVTRSIETWDLQFEMIKAGRAEMAMGSLDGQLVSAGLYIDEGLRTIYGTGIYERSLFDKPLAHHLLYQAIIRAKERGQHQFFVGDVYAKESVDAKQFQIGDFKKGFCRDVQVDLVWTLTSDHQE